MKIFNNEISYAEELIYAEETIIRLLSKLN